MFSYLWSWLCSLAQSCLLDILSAGPRPKHVAFIMDGNRRYARMTQRPVSEGHREGFLALARTLDFCRRLDIRCVSVYVFALDNFHRSADEVDGLMNLAAEGMHQLSQQEESLKTSHVRLNIIGRKELLPFKLQEAVQTVEDLTRHNDRYTLNLHIAYSSRDEITSAVESAVNDTFGMGTDITERDIERHLATSVVDCPLVDILIRTSGVKRLSDYLLWQVNQNTQIHFVSNHWPKFSLWDLTPAILNFQRKRWDRV